MVMVMKEIQKMKKIMLRNYGKYFKNINNKETKKNMRSL